MPYRRSYAEDPALCDRVFELLATWRPELAEQRVRAERLNWRWESCSTPFAIVEEGRVLAHVGVLEDPLWVQGRELRVGGIHAVCTLQERRRQGLYRRLMDEVLPWCDERWATLVLSTEDPFLYEPFGFRVVPESAFLLRRAIGPASGDLRPLELGDAADLARLERLLETRTPLSDVVSVVGERDVFKFNQAHGGIWLSERLDLVVVLGREGERLVLRDVVSPRLPTLDELLSELPGPAAEVLLCFSPDKFEIDGVALPVPEAEGVFMVRGPFAAEGRPFMLPPTARH